MPQNHGFSDTRITADFQVTSCIQSGTNASDSFLAEELNSANAIADIGQHIPGSLSQRGTRRRIPSLSGKTECILTELLKQSAAIAVATGGCNPEGYRRQDIREFARATCLLWA
jgi:hypothetical protein